MVTFITNTSPVAINSGGFNSDNHPDIVVSSLSNRTITVFLDYSNGSFVTNLTLATSRNPCLLVTGDFNHDNRTDLVINHSGDIISVFFGDGNGSFPGEAFFRWASLHKHSLLVILTAITKQISLSPVFTVTL
ncbi:unnamed protein product [Rotaria sp. Silwood2]|nr:unnamed protein product [Rotaria sp. Silwood2]CAF2990359.1 unnamed protein product [Rotaria sp. Silwood2]CAF3379155.1 unnamed protein product [Rotaria sp. Silwood2]CAF3869163.1 unnamed protein product [Rotaria sp. Silwood2]CAF4183908.1 unnamed protein product [Rotaria sp. Silwood2]